MRIIVPGGSGHLGTLLARALHERGDEVVVLSRKPAVAPWRVTQWNAREIDGADAVINLAGRSVDCRYGARNKALIMSSRVDTTRWIGNAIAAAAHPPRVWLQASTATIYANRYDAANDEHTGVIGGHEPDVPEKWHFSIEVATAWERAVDEAHPARTRKVKMRSAIVMSRHRGGPFSILRRLALLRVGGRAGHGRQYVSWVHERDFVRAVLWLIDHDEVDGAVNIASPNPLPNDDFMRGIREASGVRIGIPAPAWLLEIAAFFHRTETELLLKSRRVVPARLLEHGFRFDFPTWPEAAKELCHGNGRREW